MFIAPPLAKLFLCEVDASHESMIDVPYYLIAVLIGWRLLVSINRTWAFKPGKHLLLANSNY